MPSRRRFLKSASLTAATAWVSGKTAFANTLAALPSSTDAGDVVISTWAAGIAANAKAMSVLKSGGRALDAAEHGVMVTESDVTNHYVGLAGYPDRDGHVTLDACIMDEEGNAGSVTFLEGIEHPISVARLVMEKTPHVMLSGEGAQQFALQNGFTLKTGTNEESQRAYKEWLKTTGYKPVVDKDNHDTIGMLVRTAQGKLAASCTTSGMAWKMHGRVGDSPIPGAGLYVDPLVGAAAATGLGEVVIKTCGTHLVVEMMRSGASPHQACIEAVKRIMEREKNNHDIQVGFIAINKHGEVGAYSIQQGFQYALANRDKNELIDAPYLK